eukprot:COSAG04_NODE_5010_length_1783_cov_1.226247_1_plen_90_part_10
MAVGRDGALGLGGVRLSRGGDASRIACQKCIFAAATDDPRPRGQCGRAAGALWPLSGSSMARSPPSGRHPPATAVAAGAAPRLAALCAHL